MENQKENNNKGETSKKVNNIMTFIIILSMIDSAWNECEREYPIKKDSCILTYCTEEEFATNTCVVDNKIIKTQWLNNIIKVGEKYYRYLNFVTTLERDMIFQTTIFPGETKRIFFGIKENGLFYFKEKITKKEVSFFYIQVPQDKKDKPEGDIITIKTETSDKEYIFGISYGTCNVELYDFNDFDNVKTYIKSVDQFTGIHVTSLSHSLISLRPTNSSHYYLFPFLYEDDSGIGFFIPQIYIFYSENIEKTESYKKVVEGEKIKISNKKIISCYESESKKIVCFYGDEGKYKYIVIVYDENLSNPVSTELYSGKTYESEVFFKCIHLKNEIGIFVYYQSNTDYTPRLRIMQI